MVNLNCNIVDRKTFTETVTRKIDEYLYSRPSKRLAINGFPKLDYKNLRSYLADVLFTIGYIYDKPILLDMESSYYYLINGTDVAYIEKQYINIS